MFNSIQLFSSAIQKHVSLQRSTFSAVNLMYVHAFMCIYSTLSISRNFRQVEFVKTVLIKVYHDITVYCTCVLKIYQCKLSSITSNAGCRFCKFSYLTLNAYAILFLVIFFGCLISKFFRINPTAA